jgi:hypothetical protein
MSSTVITPERSVESLLQSSRIAVTSLLTCIPMIWAPRPRTSLRVLCVGAFEYLARLEGQGLGRAGRLALAHACDVGALCNDFYDQREFDRSVYRKLRRDLKRLAPERATQRYIRELRQAERDRPGAGTHGFQEPSAVIRYRVHVLVVSLKWLRAISGQPAQHRSLDALVALVGLVQLVDDLLDWKDDCDCRRPSFVTAFLRDWKRPSRTSMMPVRVCANRFRDTLLATSERNPRGVPLAAAGLLVWLLVHVLLRTRFSR